ncbi:hypothetical protein SLE2022_239500 [Rubroshorea leprosula]
MARTLEQAGLAVVPATHALTWGHDSNSSFVCVPTKIYVTGMWCISTKLKLSPAKYFDRDNESHRCQPEKSNCIFEKVTEVFSAEVWFEAFSTKV